jgi:hypothetical protein
LQIHSHQLFRTLLNDRSTATMILHAHMVCFYRLSKWKQSPIFNKSDIKTDKIIIEYKHVFIKWKIYQGNEDRGKHDEEVKKMQKKVEESENSFQNILESYILLNKMKNSAPIMVIPQHKLNEHSSYYYFV